MKFQQFALNSSTFPFYLVLTLLTLELLLIIQPTVPYSIAATFNKYISYPTTTSMVDSTSTTFKRTAWTEHHIIPEILSDPPPHETTIEFANAVKVRPGKELTVQEVEKHPTHVDWAHESGDLFTVILFDPDAPNRKNPVNAPYAHYAVVNVPSPSDIKRGDTYYPYAGSAPPPGSGLHRYIWLVYRQESGNWKLPHVDFPERRQWDWQRWLDNISGESKHQGGGSGEKAYRLVSGNFWTCKREE